jgi:hypothetical protein
MFKIYQFKSLLRSCIIGLELSKSQPLFFKLLKMSFPTNFQVANRVICNTAPSKITVPPIFENFQNKTIYV